VGNDKYYSFRALKREEARGSFHVRCRSRQGTTAVLAPHGGGIERGTSEVAQAIAAADMSFYTFEGTKASHNLTLHITSTRFDEPRCLALVSAAQGVVTIHGEASPASVVFLGGRDTDRRRCVRKSLERRGFVVKTHASQALQGLQQANICNRGLSGGGVQLELSKGLRQSFFRRLTASGCKTKTVRFWEFVDAVREGLS
jgi:phage replication-related protein YjqB (UPF0714/DUF867 family)